MSRYQWGTLPGRRRHFDDSIKRRSWKVCVRSKNVFENERKRRWEKGLDVEELKRVRKYSDDVQTRILNTS